MTRHCTAILSSMTPTVSPGLSPARRQTSPFRPWRSTSGVRRPRPSPASGYTRTHTHIRGHAKTAPPAPRSAHASLRRSPPDHRHGRIKPPLWPKPPGAPEDLPTYPTSRWSIVMLTRTTEMPLRGRSHLTDAAVVPGRPPPWPAHHGTPHGVLTYTNEDAEARWSFHPRQMRTSTTTKAHQ